MSAVSTRLVRLAAPASRVLATQAPRAFSTSARVHKSATETVKDSLKSIDRTVSDNIAIPAVDAADKVKHAAQRVTHGQAKGKAEELRGEAVGKAQELKGQAKGAAHEATGKAKGAAENVKNKL